MFAAGVLVALLGLLVTVLVHELAHAAAARAFGVRVHKVVAGFGPVVASVRVKGTVYGLGLFPLGGYARIGGMVPPYDAPRPARLLPRLAWRARTLVRARLDAEPGTEPVPESESLYARPPWQRALVMLAGPAANLVLALLTIVVTLSGLGVPAASLTVGQVDSCVPVLAVADAPCLPGSAGPAKDAGLRAGDTITALGGRAVPDWATVQSRLERAAPGSTVTLGYTRDGQLQTATVTLGKTRRAVTDSNGDVRMSDGQAVTQPVAFLGVVPGVEYRRAPLAESAATAGRSVLETGRLAVALPGRLVSAVGQARSGAPRSVTDPVSVVGAVDVGGQVFASDAPMLTDGAKLRVLLAMLAALNLAVALLNLLPVPPLDGAHVAGVGVESARRRVARRRGLPEPGPFDVSAWLPVSVTAALAGVFFLVVLLVSDVTNPVRTGF